MESYEVRDHRKEELKTSQPFGVYGYDKFMSNWGLAEGGYSVAIWYCKAADADKVEAWVNSRKEMCWVGVEHHKVVISKAVSVSEGKSTTGREVTHVSLYSIDEGHPALEGVKL